MRMLDLFCGRLREAQLLRTANSLVDELVARRAEEPNHVRLSVFHIGSDPATNMLVLRAMRDFQNSGFSACLAFAFQVRISTEKSVGLRVPEAVARMIGEPILPVDGRVPLSEGEDVLIGSGARALRGTILAVGARLLREEASSTLAAIPAHFKHTADALASFSGGIGRACWGAIFSIWPLGRELTPAPPTNEVHNSDYTVTYA